MKLKFSKMHGLGNDFVVLDGVRQQVSLSPEQLVYLADRHFGVGCDQILLVEKPSQPGIDFRYRIFNADGGEVEQCGNGARCFVRFVHDQGLTDKRQIRVETLKGIIEPRLEADGNVTVDMGEPRFLPAEIPFLADDDVIIHLLDVADETLETTVVSMGNPHAVLRVDNVDQAPVDELGPQIEGHVRFPRRVNAGFMEVINRGHIKLRVYERGSGETLACGSGACAAVVAGIRLGWLDKTVDVDMSGGRLTISWAGPGQSVMMTGPAVKVFDGEIEVPQL